MMDVEETLENMEDPEALKKFVNDSKTAIIKMPNKYKLTATNILW